MKISTAGASIMLAAAAAIAVPGVASADDPEFPRNGVIPAGDYRISRNPSNFVGSPIENCILRVADNASTVNLDCATWSRPGRQNPVGTDQTYVTFDGVPIGLDLHDIDPRQGIWTGTANVAGTPIIAPYPLAGLWLARS